MEVSLRSADGFEIGRHQIKTCISKSGSDYKVYAPLVHEVYVCSASKFRQGTHSTINKAAFKGGSRKPWRQKGSGRARAGGADSPIWVGGAVAHGPTSNKNYLRRVSSRSKALALSALFCSRSDEGSLFGLDSSFSKVSKTKDADRVLKVLRSCSNQSSQILFVISGQEGDALISRAARNIPYVSVCEVGKIGVAEVLHTGSVVFTAESLELLPKRFERWL